MPSLIVTSRFTSDSQRLRTAAQSLGWETLRLDGWQLPEWFNPPDDQFAIFHTAPVAFEIADQLSRILVGCDSGWTPGLPKQLLQRELSVVSLSAARSRRGTYFAKHSISKAFPAGLYDAASLKAATENTPGSALLHIGEPVEWEVEYRCFIANRCVVTLSPYKRGQRIIEDHDDTLDAPTSEYDDARQFAESVLSNGEIACPPAFVLDVGIIKNRGWAVVEVNECWASGIYSCEPERVLQTLLRSALHRDDSSADIKRWNFRDLYFTACADRR